MMGDWILKADPERWWIIALMLRGYGRLVGRILGPAESVIAYGAYQFDDYSK